MPFRSMEQDGVLTPDDLDFLQDVYDAATAGITNIDDGAMHDVVRVLIRHYRSGERDKDRLAALASGELHRAAG